jgi:hypothetical protein
MECEILFYGHVKAHTCSRINGPDTLKQNEADCLTCLKKLASDQAGNNNNIETTHMIKVTFPKILIA